MGSVPFKRRVRLEEFGETALLHDRFHESSNALRLLAQIHGPIREKEEFLRDVHLTWYAGVWICYLKLTSCHITATNIKRITPTIRPADRYINNKRQSAQARLMMECIRQLTLPNIQKYGFPTLFVVSSLEYNAGIGRVKMSVVFMWNSYCN